MSLSRTGRVREQVSTYFPCAKLPYSYFEYTVYSQQRVNFQCAEPKVVLLHPSASVIRVHDVWQRNVSCSLQRAAAY